MDTVEIQVQPADRRVIAKMRHLRVVDLIKIDQRPVPDKEITAHFCQAACLQPLGKFSKVIRQQIRIATSGKDQITI